LAGTLPGRRWVPVTTAGCFYTIITLLMARDVVARIDTVMLHDAGDPVLAAALLAWNATHIPFTDAWWQLPAFYPVADTLAFSEHLLGVSMLGSPLYWLIGDPIVTYNVVALATFPLCALSMYALARYLTQSDAGAFVAGLAFGFSPYQISQLTHVQMLAAFWAPLALLGLHTYLDTGKRRWLALYGAAWLLQAAANGYALMFLSILIGLWVLWFVVLRARWRDLGAIALTTAMAALPLAPILYRYIQVHDRHGFVRSLEEVRMFSADAGALLCASPELSVWGGLRIGCRPEAELFPGLALVLICVVGLVRALGGWGTGAGAMRPRIVVVVRWVLLVIACVSAALTVYVAALGPWRIELGPLRASSSSIQQPLSMAVGASLALLLLSPTARTAMRRPSITGFYLLAAFITWILALGPVVTYLNRSVGVAGPFVWLAMLPGFDSLRVPARFWLLSVLCLAIVAGMGIAALLRGRARSGAAAVILLTAAGLMSDGWTTMVWEPAPGGVPAPGVLAGQVVVEPPTGGDYKHDAAAIFRAVTGGWTSVNGWSGYAPVYYGALADAWRAGEPGGLLPFQRRGPLHVVASRSTPALLELIEQQPGAVRTADNDRAVQFRLPAVPAPPAGEAGERVQIRAVESPCSTTLVPLAADGDNRSAWRCDLQDERQYLTIDLGRVTGVGRLVHVQHTYVSELPWGLRVSTSEDGTTWRQGWSGPVFAEAIEGGLANPTSLRIALPFEPRAARYVRVQRIAFDPKKAWAVAELEVWSGSAGS
jgi:hypothetical protein